MYRDTLTEHWKNLYSDFAGEYDRLKAQGKEPACFDQWYETRIHRWQSVAYPEGIILEQAGSEAFTQALIEVMRDFRFQYVERRKGRPAWQGLVLGVAAGVAAALFLQLLHWETVRMIISGVVVCIVAVLGFLRAEDAAKSNEQKRVKEAYISQLRDYLPQLTAVCAEFEVD